MTAMRFYWCYSTRILRRKPSTKPRGPRLWRPSPRQAPARETSEALWLCRNSNPLPRCAGSGQQLRRNLQRYTAYSRMHTDLLVRSQKCQPKVEREFSQFIVELLTVVGMFSSPFALERL